MQSIDSFSKGYFVHLPKAVARKSKPAHDLLNNISSELWNKGYSKVWRSIEKKLNDIEDDAMQVLIKDLISFIQESPMNQNQIPSVILLTGINLPDHSLLFNHFQDTLKKLVTPFVVMLSSSDCTSIKLTIEQITSQFMKRQPDPSIMEVDEESDSDIEEINIKKSECTLPSLLKWYFELKEHRQLVIVIKDFEGFQPKILSHLILILSGYINLLPIILVFGVATNEAAIGESLTHKTSSRLKLKVFQSQPSIYFLNNIVDKVFLSPICPFQLSGKLFNFFISIFLFYDFSVSRFVQGIKYCVMDHFYQNDLVGLLCQKQEVFSKNVLKLDDDCLRQIRDLPSFKKYIEDTQDNKLKTNDKYTKEEIFKLLQLLRKSVEDYYICLRVLYTLVKDLPQEPFGKQFREVYCLSMSKDITKTSEFMECRQLLKFLSKNELESKLDQILDILGEGRFPDIINELKNFSYELKNSNLNSNSSIDVKSPSKIDLKVKNRLQLKQKLAEMSAMGKKKVGYEAVREKIIDFIMESFLRQNLIPFTEKAVLWELITIRDIDARNKVVPRIRGPIHTALNNPHHYLMCECCKIKDDAEILPTMPDICIAYKLHLEGGPLINLYDWLQSFATILNPKRNLDAPEDIDPEIQARFTQAIAELEFLGFIKSSNIKLDHVARLTWGST